MNDKDVIKMVSLIQEISIEKYDQQKYMEIVQEIYSAFQSQIYQSYKNSEVIRRGGDK